MVLFFPMDCVAISHTFGQTRPNTTLREPESGCDDCDGRGGRGCCDGCYGCCDGCGGRDDRGGCDGVARG